MLVVHFALASYRQDKDGVDAGHEAVKRDVAMGLTSNHQFTITVFDWPADQRAVAQDLDCLDDLVMR